MEIGSGVRVLLTGANGLIGSAVAAALSGDGHEVTGTTRRTGGPSCLARRVEIDMRAATRPEDWSAHLIGIEAVINCVGVLQDNNADSTSNAHAVGPAALFKACELAGVRKVIHLSAIGMDRETPTAFSESKARGDAALAASDLDWVILRPSVVVGQAAYGGSALFRALATLPVLFELPNAGKIQVVQLSDLIATIRYFLRPDAPARVALEVAGPERLSLADIVGEYRAWMGWSPARRITLPHAVMRAVFATGDFAGWLGWRPPIRSTALAEMSRGAIGDSAPWSAMTGIQPSSLRRSLRAQPASVQDKWIARLYLLKPVIFAVLSLFWIATAFMSLGPGWDIGVGLLNEGGVTGTSVAATIIAGALADFMIGIGIALRKTARPALYAAFGLTLAYGVIGSFLVPRLWIDPLGPMLKIWPVLALNMVAIAILEDRG
jgi:uncharacterized protein YbjT (DUF2867 family)